MTDVGRESEASPHFLKMIQFFTLRDRCSLPPYVLPNLSIISK